MNRADLQTLAKIRLEEARTLLAAGHPSGAYYLAGYAVECALKAAIARQTQQYDFPDKQRVLDSFTDDLQKLGEVALLNQRLSSKTELASQLRNNWKLVVNWSESSRYSEHPLENARAMLMAVGDDVHGVFPWITQYW